MYIGQIPVPLNAQVVGDSGGIVTYNFLPYTPSDTGTTSYFNTQTLNRINDGAFLVGQDGAISQSSNLPVIMTFAAPVHLNRLRYFPGQFNGPANAPKTFSIYRGATTATLLYSFDYGAAYNSAMSGWQTFELFGRTGFDIASNIFRIDFFSPTGFTSVMELEAYGQVA